MAASFLTIHQTNSSEVYPCIIRDRQAVTMAKLTKVYTSPPLHLCEFPLQMHTPCPIRGMNHTIQKELYPSHAQKTNKLSSRQPSKHQHSNDKPTVNTLTPTFKTHRCLKSISISTLLPYMRTQFFGGIYCFSATPKPPQSTVVVTAEEQHQQQPP